METLLITLTCLVCISILLLIILLISSSKKKISFDDAEIYRIRDSIRDSLVSEFNRILASLDSTLEKNNAQIQNINTQVNNAFIAINQSNKQSMEALFTQLSDMNKMQSDKLSSIQVSMNENIDRIRKANSEAFVDISNKSENLTKQVHDSLDSIRKENNEQSTSAFNTINQSNKQSMETLFKQLSDMNKMQSDKLSSIQVSMNENIDRIRKANSEAFVDISNKSENLTKQVHDSLDNIRKENNTKLDEMRNVVEEKLQATLNERISQSFKVISESLKELHESLGSLNTLTSDVQSINRIFSNVKTRGIWGEVQAENILSEILSQDQYVKDYSPRNNREKVEFAIKLPGKNNTGSVYLPIDSKFPLSDYEKYKEAIDSHNEDNIIAALKDVKNRVVSEAKDIQKKYIVTPDTTDFGILFVPAESIYIELLRIPEFVDKLQNEQRVILTGPNNFAALLNSLRLGFKTLQIERYTSQIWHSFETLKKYFSDLSGAIEASRKAVDKAQSELENASKKKEKLETVICQIEGTGERSNMLEYKDDAKEIIIE